jgi:hypothetical protein
MTFIVTLKSPINKKAKLRMSPGNVGIGALLILVASTAACQQKAVSSGFPGKAVIVVTGHGVDRPDSICSGFRLTEAQVRQFFERSHPITQKELHDRYDYMPCWVEGKIVSSGETLTWKIRPVGIGEIHHRGGAIDLRGCKKCDNLFK